MDWVEREELESTAKQIVGLLWSESQPSRVAIAVSQATNNAIGDGLIQAHDYDAWHTGMASGSGWRQSVAATTYGVIRARQLSSKAKSNTSLASARRGIGGVSVNTGELGTAVNTHDHGVAVNTAPGGAAISTGDFGVAVSTGGGMQPIPKPGDVDEVRPREADDKYAWARQAELVKAVNDVLGEGTLHKGVLSRACTDGQVETNRQPGPGSRVSTNSFLAWVTRKFELAKNEQTQVRNAVIGEIRARNS